MSAHDYPDGLRREIEEHIYDTHRCEITIPEASRAILQDIGKWRSAKAQELVCEICDRDYPVWSADNDLWNEVMRLPDGSDQHSFVCPTCFTVRAAFQGVETSFRLKRSMVL